MNAATFVLIATLACGDPALTFREFFATTRASRRFLAAITTRRRRCT
jgi:hypothetical protein